MSEDRLEITVHFKDGEFPRELVINRAGREVDHVTMDGERLEDVVRCRDCAKWHYFDDEDSVRYGECDEWKRADSHCMPATRENGFCAWAERRVEE